MFTPLLYGWKISHSFCDPRFALTFVATYRLFHVEHHRVGSVGCCVWGYGAVVLWCCGAVVFSTSASRCSDPCPRRRLPPTTWMFYVHASRSIRRNLELQY